MRESPSFRARIAAVTHSTQLEGAADALRTYLLRLPVDLIFVKHPFGYTGNRFSTLESWVNGSLTEQRRWWAPRWASVLRDVVANLCWFGVRPVTDGFFAFDNVNAFCGILLRAFGRTRHVVYYVIDYTPARFDNRFLNWLYHTVD